MIALIDGDILAYRPAAAAQNESEGIARYYVDQLLDEIMHGAGADSYRIFLTGKGNFRFNVYPEYKGNRIDMERPRHLKYCKDYLADMLGAVWSDGCEADDLMGANQTEDTIICSLDKDMQTVPGWHHSWEIRGKSKGTSWVKPAITQHKTEEQANRFFYTQCIIGDVADNVKGIQGAGVKTAERILAGCDTEQELFDAVRSAYDNDEEFLMNARVLYIWRKENDDYRERFNKLSEASKREVQGPDVPTENPGHDPGNIPPPGA